MDCRERLFEIWDKEYTANCKNEANDECRDSVKYILERNILCGNALSLMQVDENGNDTDTPIIFSEWSLVMGSSVKRRDFRLDVLLRKHEETSLQFSLFGDDVANPEYWETDPVTKETIPAPTKEYPLTDYRRLREND